jgi:hypothetical protein
MIPVHRCSLAVLGLLLLGAVGCSDNLAEPTGQGRVRIVNSVFQGPDAGSAVPVAIDVLVDSAAANPTANDIAAASLAEGASANATFAAAGYRDLPVGVHSFVARTAGNAATNSSLFRNPSGAEYLPRQSITPFPFTLIVAGVVPPPGTDPGSASVTFVLSVDDPFPPPQVNGVYQARFKVIHAAPYTAADGTGAAVDLYVTPGSTPPSILPATPDATAGYQGGSTYLDRDAGTYVLTLAVSGTIVVQVPITLEAGEVRSYVLQSTAAGEPSLGNHKVTALVDNAF